jgi:fucose permease
MNSLRLIFSKAIYFAPSWVFLSINILIGTWILYIPHVKTKFNLSDAEIGFSLFFVALGLLVSLPFVPVTNRKIGVGKSTKIGIIFLAIAYNLPLIATNYVFLCGALFCVGVFSGFTSTSLNTLTAIIERKEAQNFMSAAHGFFSLGGFFGAGIGSIYISQFSNPNIHMLGVSSFIMITTLLLAKNYEKVEGDAKEKSKNKPDFFKSAKPLIIISIIAFIIMFNEGAVEHWSNLFLFDVVKVSESKAGLGFIVFSLTMTIGRFLGDGFSSKIGSMKTIIYGCLIAFISYMFVISANLYLSVLGFAFLGFGLSVIVPEVFRVAGKTKELETSLAISIVSGIGFVGFLTGPVLLGAISTWGSLVTSYIFLAILIGVAFCLALFVSRKRL